ncbi:lipopolysaccharide biosynthesis regulator YciM [Phorcysia thermohydrogeniphila]|uniref:Lipopolysaccharide biosynthesis regulator YciM n=2 Tax=Phorcysia thermohydrogeniphila TaxID=936138 RepID=A0A4R1GH45_9BACT|nr:lipopolysaccharide biosynthesis regulator YciM [Phorcysia thermohydrogeniphila]
MLQKLFKFLSGKKDTSFSDYLKELSINRQDLIRHLPDIDIDSPVNAYITLAILLKEKGEYYKSLKILEKLKGERLSENEQKLLYLNLALTYRAAGFLDRAERALKEGISLFPSEGLFYYELALIYKVSNRLEEAVSLLEKAVELKGEFLDELVHTKLYLADSYIDRGRTDKAFRLLRKLDIRVPLPLFYYVMSKLYYAVGEKEKGYRKAIQGMKLSPGHVAPFLKVIDEYEGLSVDKLYEIIRETGTLAITGKLLAEKLIKENRKEEALGILEKLNEEFPNDARVKELYLRLLWESGKRKQVVEEIEKFLLDLKDRKKEFKCRNCGYETNTFDWICPRCRQWETLEIGSED